MTLDTTDRILFLDIDGVLNGHEWCHGDDGPRFNPLRCRILQSAIDRLETRGLKVGVVLCSSWRDKIIDGTLTLAGFEWMLETHGLRIDLIGHTPPGPPATRADQIRQWLTLNAIGPIDRWFVVDDLPLGLEPNQLRPDPAHGLAWRHADTIFEALK